MLISVSELNQNWGVFPNGVLHVGAHLGEEAHDYANFGWSPIIWIEAQPLLAEQLAAKFKPPTHRVINAAIWKEDGKKLKLHVASNSMSTSLLEFGSHTNSYPDIHFVDEIEVITKRIDSLIDPSQMPNFLNIDIQGAELSAIESLGSLIEKIDYIFVEVNKREVYIQCTKVHEIDAHLKEQGFKRVTTRWYVRQGWGDALYIRRSKIKARNPIQFFSTISKDSIFYLKQITWLLRFKPILKLLKHHSRRLN